MALSKDYIIEIIHHNDRLMYDNGFKKLFPHIEWEKKQEVVIKDAYCRIENIDGSKNELNIVLNIYNNINCECLIEVQKFTFTPDTSTSHTPNFYTQGYNYIKSLPNFRDAIDA